MVSLQQNHSRKPISPAAKNVPLHHEWGQSKMLQHHGSQTTGQAWWWSSICMSASFLNRQKHLTKSRILPWLKHKGAPFPFPVWRSLTIGSRQVPWKKSPQRGKLLLICELHHWPALWSLSNDNYAPNRCVTRQRIAEHSLIAGNIQEPQKENLYLSFFPQPTKEAACFNFPAYQFHIQLYIEAGF